MRLVELITGGAPGRSATATTATSATPSQEHSAGVATVADVAVAQLRERLVQLLQPLREAWEERAAIIEFEAGTSPTLAEDLALACVVDPRREILASWGSDTRGQPRGGEGGQLSPPASIGKRGF